MGNLTSTSTASKALWRARLKQDVAEYLAGGGQIHRYTARDNKGYRIEKLSRKARIAFLKRLPMEQGPGQHRDAPR